CGVACYKAILLTKHLTVISTYEYYTTRKSDIVQWLVYSTLIKGVSRETRVQFPVSELTFFLLLFLYRREDFFLMFKTESASTGKLFRLMQSSLPRLLVVRATNCKCRCPTFGLGCVMVFHRIVEAHTQLLPVL